METRGCIIKHALDSRKKESIYELPQVVIYVDGNITIAPGVTRLDAWGG